MLNIMSQYYLPNSKGKTLELTDECVIKDLRVFDTLMGLSSNFINLATNIVGTDLNITGNANIGGFVTCNRVSVASLTPTSGSHLTSKNYVDGLITTASTNLTKTGNNIAMNSSISLTGITLTGAFVGTSGTFSSTVTVATPTLGGHACNKTYVDGIALTTASGNLTKTANNFTLNPSISLTSIALTGTTDSSSILTGVLTVAGGMGISKNLYVGGAVLASGISGTSGTFSADTIISSTTPSSSSTTGALTVSGGLGVGGDINATNINASNVITANRMTVAQVTAGSQVTNKSYVDGLITTCSGNLTKTSNNITLNPSISLSTIDLTDTTDSASNGVGAFTCAGGIFSNKRIRAAGMITALGGMTSAGNITITTGGLTCTGVSSFVNSISCYGLTATGGGLTITGVSTFNNSINCSFDITCSGKVTCNTAPTAAGDLCNKTYVDNLVSTSTSNVTTGISTADFFSISGLTLNGLVKELTYSKVGKFVFCNLKATWTSATGTAAAIYPNVTVGTPFPALHRDRWIQVESQWYQYDLPVDRGKYQYPAPANSVTFKIDPSLLNNHLIGGELYVTFKFLTSA